MKILLLFPNTYLNVGIPHGLATLTAILKQEGHEVSVFDFTFIKTEKNNIEPMNDLVLLPTSCSIYDLTRNDPVETIEERFAEKLKSFDPDLIGLSATSLNYDLGINLLNKFKPSLKCKVVAGGIHTTIAPEDAIKPEAVDFICIGEGEEFIVELCDCLSRGKDCRNIRNLGFKTKNGSHFNKLRPFVNLDDLPAPDWSAFDKRHLFRPFMGKVYNGGNYIMSRGCPYSCTYCVNGPLREKLRECGKYYHFQQPTTTERHLKELKRLYNATWFRFGDDSLMSMTAEYLQDLRKRLVKLDIQFACSIRPETTTEQKVSLLKQMGCKSLSIGIESGNEELRKKILKRRMTNVQILNAVKIVNKYGIRISTYIIIGLPEETRKNVLETIKFNKILGAQAATVSILYPHHGTEIAKKYNKSFRNKNGNIIPISKASGFNLSKMSPKEVEGLQKTYNLYLQLPEEVWPVIELAENDDKVGNIILNALQKYSVRLLWAN